MFGSNYKEEKLFLKWLHRENGAVNRNKTKIVLRKVQIRNGI